MDLTKIIKGAKRSKRFTTEKEIEKLGKELHNAIVPKFLELERRRKNVCPCCGAERGK